MSDTHDPLPLGAPPPPGDLPPRVIAVRPAPPRRSGAFRMLLLLALFLSLAFNCLFVATIPGCGTSGEGILIDERYHSGKKLARHKIAIVRVEGVILEGSLAFPHKQIERAAADTDVKAVVLRINSPGGSITASDDLHRRVSELIKGNSEKNHPPKPVVVSMASIATSGGYYMAVPAPLLMAERTTMTGSIGVFAAFPNVADLADKHGVRLDVIKAGRVKDSGSMFHHMTPQERQIWQDMIDHAYRQFLAVVEAGRPKLKGQLEAEVLPKTIAVPGTGEKLAMARQRADGGIFTADQALQLGLIDKIGYLDEAVHEARDAANLGDDYRVVNYVRPLSLFGVLFGPELRAPQPKLLDPQQLANAATPRLWYLGPQSELAGFLAATGVSQP